MMPKTEPLPPYEQAMAFIATYDRPDSDDYERHVARIARQWLTIQRANQATQRIVDRLLDELAQPTPPHYGCGWSDLKIKFAAWAKTEGWLDKKKGKHMKTGHLQRLACLLFVMAPYAAHAGMIPPPFSRSPTGETAPLEFGAIHDLGAETSYDVDVLSYATGDFDVKRKTTSACIGFGDFFLAAGMIHRTEIDVALSHDYPVPLMGESGFSYLPEQQDSIDGDGFLVAVGVRSALWTKDNLSLAAYGQLTYRRESCSSSSGYTWYDTPVYEVQPEIYPPINPNPEPRSGTVENDIDIDSTEFLAGLVGRYSGQRYTFYAGIEITPFSDLEAEVTVITSGGTKFEEKYDVEPCEPVTFLLGWQASFKHGFLMLESRGVGEKGLRIGAGVNF